jgi:hypothetical protein
MIIISGDSFSKNNLRVLIEPGVSIQAPWQIWADKLSFDDKVINVSEAGIGNDLIIRNAIDALLKTSNVDRIIIALSQWVRFSIRGRAFNPQIFNGVSDNVKDTLYAKRQYQICRSDIQTLERLTNTGETEVKAIFNTQLSIKTMIDDTLRDIYILQQLCKQRGIKLHVFQMLQPLAGFNKSTRNAITKELLNSDYFDIMDSLNGIDLIGWPFVPSLGGYYFDKNLTAKERVGNGDAHPNKQGHIKLAEMFNENYKEYKV